VNSTVKYGLFGIALYALYHMGLESTAQNLRNIRLQINNVDASFNSNGGIDIIFSVNVQNPNNSKIVVNSVVGDVYLNNTKIGLVKAFGQQIVADNSEANIKLVCTVKMLAAIETFKNIFMYRSPNKKQNHVQLLGTVNINNKALPLNINFLL